MAAEKSSIKDYITYAVVALTTLGGSEGLDYFQENDFVSYKEWVVDQFEKADDERTKLENRLDELEKNWARAEPLVQMREKELFGETESPYIETDVDYVKRQRSTGKLWYFRPSGVKVRAYWNATDGYTFQLGGCWWRCEYDQDNPGLIDRWSAAGDCNH